MKNIFTFSIDHPKLVITLVVLISVFFLFQFPKVKIDTDPENMLDRNEPVRLVHNEMKETFDLHDMIVVGIFREDGVYTRETLTRIVAITDEIKEIDGVLDDDVIALGEVDDISSEGDVLRVYPLREYISESTEEAGISIRDRIDANPVLRNKLASLDGKLMVIYVPVEEKNLSYTISKQIEEIAERHLEDEQYYLAGLPVAEDTFGNEMFKQMGITAPLAGLVIALLMFLFFRRVKLILAPMILAMITVIWTMGLLIGLGFTVHVMSSMIPIFLFPIAVLDSIHILSDIFEKHQRTGDIKKTVLDSLGDLFSPMLFTTLTSFAGFVSLTLTPIPPVQVFGLFVGFGIITAWVLSMTFLPAYTVLMPKKTFEGFGVKVDAEKTFIARILKVVQGWSLRWSKLIVVTTAAVIVVSVIGISKIIVNDNPVNWFKPNHPLRVADVVMNEHLGGTYMSNIIFTGNSGSFKDPEVVSYVEKVQRIISELPGVGATTSVVDILHKIGYELRGDDSLPGSSDEIAQYYFLYELSGGDPDDLFTFVTSDYDKAHILIQMKQGENVLMKSVVDKVANFMAENPPPAGITTDWAGLTYVNMVWQEKMVRGMGYALLGGFVAVLIMMVILFRSFLWAFLSMIPLVTTITFIYGLIGYIGKPYDMPIAVLSTLTLGLSIDFAIHFIRRAQAIHKKTGDFNKTMDLVFGEPAKAITINMLVIAVGFVPLFFSNLMPYVTVGTFLFLIMLTSGIATLVILPALSKLMQKTLFPVQ